MIEIFYNLNRIPFQKNIRPEQIFNSNASAELNKRLDYIKEKRGMMLLTGMPGTGKTFHLRFFIEKLNPNQYKYFYFPLSTVNILDFYRQLSVELIDEKHWQKSQLFKAIQDAIKNYIENQKKIPVIIFDEAHLLKNEIFSELQIITNFNLDSIDPCLFIIAGQPHLKDRLLRPIHFSFNQRFALKFEIPPLNLIETKSYIEHHLSLCGLKEPIFNDNAYQAIYQNTAGIPRMINHLTLKSMILGASNHKKLLSEEEVFIAYQEL
jgi:type II secretory pathway predicted ATPase ExeA